MFPESFITLVPDVRGRAVDRRGSLQVGHDPVGLLPKLVGVSPDLVSVHALGHALGQVGSHRVHQRRHRRRGRRRGQRRLRVFRRRS